MKKQLSNLIAGTALLMAVPAAAQNNLGAACGCPPVNARTTVTASSLPGFSVVPNAQGGELTLGGAWTCDKTYILDQKIYVAPGTTLYIEPGTVIKGNAVVTPSLATALIVERGAKLIADGTADCPIVFTAAADPMDNSYSVTNKGMWGGLVVLGRATNNLKLNPNGPFVVGGTGKLAVADGLGVVEGFATSIPQDRYGVNTSTVVIAGEGVSQSFDDNDNSGIFRNISIRHSGAILAVGAEINGITLGSVGRGTILENIELVSCADDNIEFFGGTVNAKRISMMFGNDDGLDWDCGYTGKIQYVFSLSAPDASFSADIDNGIEADSDDNKSNLLPRSHPVVYNGTFVGRNKTAATADNGPRAGIIAKEITEGEIYNCIFANYEHGFSMIQALGTRTGGFEAYHNWTSGTGSNTAYPQSLKVQCNTFVGITKPLALNNATTGLTPGDFAQFAAEGNTVVAGNTLPGFSYTYAINAPTNAFGTRPDLIPNPALSVTGCPVAPVDGFYSAAPYRGAFLSSGKNWLSDWSYSAVLGAVAGLAPCPSDLNGDGATNVSDFLIFAPAFGTSCN